jgi:hypothetical protein
MEKDKVIESIEQRAITQESDLKYLTAEQQFEKIMARVSELPEPVVSSDDLLERLRPGHTHRSCGVFVKPPPLPADGS